MTNRELLDKLAALPEPGQEPDLHLPRAQRFAQAIADAAAASDRVNLLVERLTESEYHRSVAESQLSAITLDDRIGKVTTAADPEPPEGCDTILDLYSGEVWRRSGKSHWKRAGQESVLHTWPMPDGGPFIEFKEEWHFRRTLDRLEALEALDRELRQQLRREDGYQMEGDSTWTQPPLPDALSRVLHSLKLRAAGEKGRAAEAEVRQREAELALAQYKESPGNAALMVTELLERATKEGLAPKEASAHGLVRLAEHQLIQDVDVPEDGGDPRYSADSLSKAAAILLSAIAAAKAEEGL